MMEEDTGEETLIDKASEEDEIDLYINLTFTSGKIRWNSKSRPLWLEQRACNDIVAGQE